MIAGSPFADRGIGTGEKIGQVEQRNNTPRPAEAVCGAEARALLYLGKLVIMFSDRIAFQGQDHPSIDMREPAMEKKHASGRVPHGDISRRVGVEQVKSRGVDVEALIEKLIDAAAAEFTTYYYYTILRMHLAGHEDYKEICEDARLEDRAHFEFVVPRIYELGGGIPRDIRAFADRASCPDAYLPDEPKAENILVTLLEAERCAIRTWSEICDLTLGKDPRTYDIAARILQEEIEHEAWFIELLAHERGEGPRPSGHFRRGTPGEAPYSKNRSFYNP